MNRIDVLHKVQALYISSRVSKIDRDYLQLEEDLTSIDDLNRILITPVSSLPNPYNSYLLYVTGITDDLDFSRRVELKGGSPPDVDLDIDTEAFNRVTNWVVNKYGRENVANILTVQKFKPRGLARKYYSVTAPDPESKEYPQHLDDLKEVLGAIPDALFGKEPTLQECIDGDKKKGFEPHPELNKHQGFLKVAKALEGLVSQYGVHACGYVIADKPISNYVPLWSRTIEDEYTKTPDQRWISQNTAEELEELSLLKFDLLRIQNLTIIKQCLKLIKERHNIDINPYLIEDGNKPAYALLHLGYMGGIFQLETSNATKNYTMKMKPTSFDGLGIVSALVRPGPLQGGLADEFVENKNNGYPSANMPEIFVNLLKDTCWVMAYQEQLIEIVHKVAGFSLAESDAIRRAVGKKKTDKILPYKEAFINGCLKNNVSVEYATYFWEDIIVGQSDYQFNRSHALTYSYLSYVCAYLKANYPLEFFASLMDVRSKVSTPQEWAERAPTYIQEAQFFNINMISPSINRSSVGFTISKNDSIYFGLNSIKRVGYNASRLIVSARGANPFTDIWDFLNRIDKSKMNVAVFKSLVSAGAFDCLGYKRQDLLDNTEHLYEWYRWAKECEERVLTNHLRQIENSSIQQLIEQRDEIRKRAKKKGYILTEEEETFLSEHKRIALHRELKIPDEPIKPIIEQHKQIKVSANELLEQGLLIGCLITNPLKLIYPNTQQIINIEDTQIYHLAGIVNDIVTYSNPRGKTTYVTINDGTASLRIPIYSNTKNIVVPKKNDVIYVKVKAGKPLSIDSDVQQAKVYSIQQLSIYER